MEPPWGDEWGLTLRPCVQQRHLLSFIVCVCSVPVGSGSPACQLVHRQSTTGTFSLCAGEDRHSTEGLKDFCFGKSEHRFRSVGERECCLEEREEREIVWLPCSNWDISPAGKMETWHVVFPEECVLPPHAELDAGCVTGK